MSGNSLEEIRLVVENVKHKKVEGTLYLMSERIAWMPKGKTAFSTSHHYVDIKTQKISTEGKAKVQLQVVLHDDTSSVFHFVAPGGQQQQIKDRDQVKDLLAVLLPKFKQKISKELEEKKRILIENPQIYQLYNDLVVGQVVSAEDFWKNFVDVSEFKHETKNQMTGVSQAFMAKITPKSDGANGLKSNITYDDIQSIFKTYPAVKLKYIQNVPQRMSEEDFWTKFFQSFYFRKDQINAMPNDLFADCAFKDDEELRTKLKRALTDPVDIIDSQKNFSNEDGFGLTDFQARSGNMANTNLIKRYNYYSMRILESMEENSKETANEPPTSKPESAKKARLNEEIKDLEKEELTNLRGATLNLVHVDRYFYAPKTTTQKQSPVVQALHGQDSRQLCQSSLNQAINWSMNIRKIANPSLAVGILVELSPGSELMQSNNVQNLKDVIPKPNQEEVKAVYVSTCEMLKKFHAMFPPKNTEQELKLKAMRDALENFYQQKIITLHDRLTKENFPWNLTENLEAMFKIALLKYNAWKLKQGQ